METEQKTPGLNTDLKANIAILLSIAALAVSLFGGGGLLKPSVPDGPEGFIKQTAKDAGIGGRTYDQCIEDTTIEPLILEDVNETNAIASFAEMAGIGTPFNVIVTDRQVIPVSGAYPYELFDSFSTLLKNKVQLIKKHSHNLKSPNLITKLCDSSDHLIL